MRALVLVEIGGERGRDEREVYVPVVVVECLELGEVTVEGRHVFRPYAPECSNLQDFA